MLTSQSQYLHPDYLQPLPTTLDAKKSPLALLAQTCSSIGKDTTPSKPMIPPLEKKESGGKHSPQNQKRDERKLSISSPRRETSSCDSTKQNFRVPPPKEIPPLVPITSTHREKSPKNTSVDRRSPSKSPNSGGNFQHTTSSSNGNINNNNTKEHTNSSRISLNCGSMSVEVNHHENVNGKSGLSASSQPSPALTANTPKHMGHSLLYPGAGALSYPSYAHLYSGLDVAAVAAQSYHAALAAHASLGLSHLHAASQANSPTSPYVSYARVKTATGDQSLVPICKDPYCTTCQISMQNAQLSSCTVPGCTQCGQHRLPPSTLPSGVSSLGLLMPSFGGGLYSTAGSALHLPTSSPYGHSHNVTTGVAPFVCNWMAGSDYCGKRFTSSDELLQHLRTHTSATDAYSSLLQSHGLVGGLAGLPAASALAAAHYPAPSLSPNTLRRLYPTSLSPGSSSRYHPYSKPSSLQSLASMPTAPTLPLPGLSALYGSPYAALYGHKLGTALAP